MDAAFDVEAGMDLVVWVVAVVGEVDSSGMDSVADVSLLDGLVVTFVPFKATVGLPPPPATVMLLFSFPALPPLLFALCL